MAGLVETGGSAGARSSVASARSDLGGSADEREYVAHRAAILAMLGAQFPNLSDPEEIYHDAWVELLELGRRGEQVRHHRALLKTIAWRRAAKVAKQRRRSVVTDPAGLVVDGAVDTRMGPDEEAQRRLDGDALRLMVESLGEREAAILKLRFDCQLSAKEVQGVLGIGEKRMEAAVTRAFRRIAEQLEVGADGVSAWTRRQRSLLLACELGIASVRQRRQAQRMLDRDPACRALLVAMRRGLDDVVAVLPVPALVEEHERVRRVAGMTGRLDEWLAGARQVAERVVGRSESGLVEQAGIGGASAGLGAIAVKAVAVCVVVGGAAVICLDGSDELTERPASAVAAPKVQRERIVEPPREHVVVVRAPVHAKSTKKTKAVAHPKTPASSSPKSRPAPSPAPAGSTEFGPGVLGSTAAPKQPAAAPEDGGGEFTP